MAKPISWTDKKRISRLADLGFCTGRVHIRNFGCPVGSVATVLATGGELAMGSELAEDHGGVASGSRTAATAKLFAVNVDRNPVKGHYAMQAQYLELDAGTASGGYHELSNARVNRSTQHEIRWRVYGIASARTSTGIPSRGDGLDGTTALMGPTARAPAIDETWRPGRVLVVTDYIGSRAYGS